MTPHDLAEMLIRAEELAEVCQICSGTGTLDCEEGRPYCENECPTPGEQCHSPCPYCTDFPLVIRELQAAQERISELERENGEMRAARSFDALTIATGTSGECVRLRSEVAETREIVKGVADGGWQSAMMGGLCRCPVKHHPPTDPDPEAYDDSWDEPMHGPDCLYLHARKYLEGKDES